LIRALLAPTHSARRDMNYSQQFIGITRLGSLRPCFSMLPRWDCRMRFSIQFAQRQNPRKSKFASVFWNLSSPFIHLLRLIYKYLLLTVKCLWPWTRNHRIG